MEHSLLIVDDDTDLCRLLRTRLTRRGFEIVTCLSAEEALGTLKERPFDVVVTDLRLGALNGLSLCERVVANHQVPVVVMTAWASTETVVSALRAGAVDFVSKPFETDTLVEIVEQLLRRRDVRQRIDHLPRESNDGFEEIVGRSEPIAEVRVLLRQIARHDASVLVTGESGTGKELVARGLHKRSGRAHGPFVAINCAAMPEALLESQLFGHVRGAFTDAREERPGLLAHASGGTLFLDEIGDMPLSLQPKLLRALQERRVRPVGSDVEVPFDVRLIVASNRDLAAEVAHGRFRTDLFYRVNVIQVELPALRERGDDVILLAERAVRQFARRSGKPVAGLTAASAERLLDYHWPGNVRELFNCIERAVTLTHHCRIVAEDLPGHIRNYANWHFEPDQPPAAAGGSTALVSVEEVERRHILDVLRELKGNKTKAARVLGLDRKTLYRKLKQYEAMTRLVDATASEDVIRRELR